ncbi:transposable element Tcb2 transposase [Trichonephila clavipes]|nr:transposable element Tcb2 transposase [Trichonephila clavipes]
MLQIIRKRLLVLFNSRSNTDSVSANDCYLKSGRLSSSSFYKNQLKGQFSSKIMLVRIQQELARSPDLSPVEHVRDQLKRQRPSCHSVHDLELAVQDLWAHLPQDNIRCLINSMLDRVAACISAGGGPTRY